ncbi:hypothetical protein OPV22_012739 [Ensete ventricosum]|uniref:X8 domain-containing protein n=1 Tax=Ensete ventricosum TaxID=4639 RepID=A0AAV8PHR4_ENSVE|nr:hypothetical protein OPV22_012739 [Ensete ventricosum]
MRTGKWEKIVLLLIFLFSSASGAFIGINIGTQMSSLPSAAEIVSILKTQQVKHVRLFDADHQMLNALANTGIEVTVGVPNDQLLRIGESRSEAANWINKNVAAFVPATNITYIAVGNEVKVSSPQSMDMIPKHFPPSTATFNLSWNSVMYQYLQFLKNTGSSFMLNAQPYYAYAKGQGIFPLEYALFRPLDPNNQIVDPNTNFQYTNMFDAMIDAAYYSMQSLNFSNIPVTVTASGWPSLGGASEPEANIDNALAYNRNLIRHVLNGSGTPSQPTTSVSAYVHELFNEDLRPGPVSEKNWGIFASNGTAVYSVTFGHLAESSAESTGLVGVFCVANSSADSNALKKGLDWACGPGSANCTAIQQGQPCYEANNLVAIASYAYNDYYHRTQANGGSCNFGNTAMITTTDPSHGSCIFAGSSGSSTSSTEGTTPSAFGPVGALSGASRLQFVSSTFLVAVLLTFLV